VIVTDHASVDTARVVARAQRVFDTRNATKGVREGSEKVRRL
jgi:UDP-N-acetyl-D-glucosamine dehydrogenase